MRYALAAVMFTACTNVASITPDVCGNDVLEPGEDCDRPGGACTADCRISCDPLMRGTMCASADAIDGTCCPSDMACGLDKVCHVITGTVATTTIDSTYEDTNFQLGDVNGDMIADFLGVAANTTELRYGSQTTPFSTIVAARSPTLPQGSQLGFGDFDGDQRLDVVIPTTTGLFAFTTDDGGLDPVQFPATVTPGVVHERVAYIGNFLGILQGFVRLDYVPNHPTGQSNFQLVLSTAPTYGIQSYTVVDTQASMCSLGTIAADAFNRPRGLHPFFDNGTIRVPFAIGGTAVGVCIATANPTFQIGSTPPSPSYAVPKAVFGAGYKVAGVDGETFFANLLATTGCPDLVVPLMDLAETTDYTMVIKGQSTSANGCGVDVTTTVLVRGKPLAAISLQPTNLLGGLGTPIPGLITTIGVYSFNGTTPKLETPATRPWHYAVAGDLDGDGRPDFATVGALNDVEVFRQLPWLAGLQTIQWNDYVIPTASQVQLIALGNFDGDKAGDVAVATVDPTTSTSVELAIAWGNVDGTFELDDVGPFAEGHSLTVLDLVDTSLPPGVDHDDDLLVARGGGVGTDPNDPALMIAVYGSTTRAMTAPFVFASGFGSNSTTRAVGVAATVGAFGDGGASGVAAIFAAPPNSSTLGTSNSAIMDLTSQSYGGFTATPPTLFTSCAPALMGSTDLPFCASSAHYMRMHRSAGDLLLGLRQDKVSSTSSQCAAYFVANGAQPQLTTISCAALAPGAAAATDPIVEAAYANLTGAGLRALAGDGTTQQIALVSRAAPQFAYLWQLTVDSNGEPQLANPIDLSHELQSSGILASGATANCQDVIGAELGTRTANGTIYGDNQRELAVICVIAQDGASDAQVFARYADPGGGAPLYTQLLDLHRSAATASRSGDVNGDGLDDLVWTEGPSGRGSLHVLLQCDGHQTDCGGGQ